MVRQAHQNCTDEKDSHGCTDKKVISVLVAKKKATDGSTGSRTDAEPQSPSVPAH